MKVLIKNWKAGFGKISLTKLLMEKTDITMHAAKGLTDEVLAHKQITIKFDNQDDAKSFLEEVIRIGAVAEIE